MPEKNCNTPIYKNNGIRIATAYIGATVLAITLIFTIANLTMQATDRAMENLADRLVEHKSLTGHEGILGKVETIDVKFAEVETQFNNQETHIDLQRQKLERCEAMSKEYGEELARLRVEINHLKQWEGR